MGGKVELVVVNYNDSHAMAIEALGPTSIQVLEMNLEDAFVAYTRDAGPAKPSFEWELVKC